MSEESIYNFSNVLLHNQNASAEEIWTNSERKQIPNITRLLYNFYNHRARLGAVMVAAVRRALKKVDPTYLFSDERTFASAFLGHAFESIPSKKFATMLTAQLVEDADSASINNMYSCLDCCKIFFRQLERSAEACPLELREALVALAKAISSRMEKKIKKGGEYVSATVQETCRERALLLMLRHWNSQAIFPAIRQAMLANDASSGADLNILNFIEHFINYVATGDIAPLKNLSIQAGWSPADLKQVKKYAAKWRRRILVALGRYIDASALRAQRGPASELDYDSSMIAETQETDLRALSDAVHTYRLCKYTQSLTPRNIVRLRYKMAAKRTQHAEGQGFYAEPEDSTDTDSEPPLQMEGSTSRKRISSSESTLSDSMGSVESDALSVPDMSRYINDVDMHVGRAIPDLKHYRLRESKVRIEPNIVLSTGLVVLTFVRQFGCPVCRKQLNILAQLMPYFNKMDAKVVAIGTGSSKAAQAAQTLSGFQNTIYRDKAAKIFKAFGCQRGIGAALNSKSLDALRLAQAEGYKSGSKQGHMLQLGGTFVLYNGEMIFEHVETFIGDFPDYREVVKACGVPHEEILKLNLKAPSELTATGATDPFSAALVRGARASSFASSTTSSTQASPADHKHRSTRSS